MRAGAGVEAGVKTQAEREGEGNIGIGTFERGILRRVHALGWAGTFSGIHKPRPLRDAQNPVPKGPPPSGDRDVWCC